MSRDDAQPVDWSLTARDGAERGQLRRYSDEYLASLDPAELIELLIDDEDRVPRAVIDECARRGDEMLRPLGLWVEGEPAADELIGEWWLRLHAAMILGLMSSEAAGLLLVRLMRRLSEAADDGPEDWLAPHWPALFANKPEAVLTELRRMSADRSLDWYLRANTLDTVVTFDERRGPQALEEALDWLGRMAGDEAEDWDTRISCGHLLLDFPRPRFRVLLDDLAERQIGAGADFLAGDVEQAYTGQFERFDHGEPWAFYRPEAIAERQERWAREEAEEGDENPYYEGPDGGPPALEETPYVRPASKVGRNDPCPCGSGKKFKKCCLGRLTW